MLMPKVRSLKPLFPYDDIHTNSKPCGVHLNLNNLKSFQCLFFKGWLCHDDEQESKPKNKLSAEEQVDIS